MNSVEAARTPSGVAAAVRCLPRGFPDFAEGGIAPGPASSRRLAARRCRCSAGEQLATRDAGQKAMDAFAALVPTMIGGSADLVESTKTVFEGAGEFSKVHAGRNVHFGIREHAMGAIVNGTAAHGGTSSRTARPS